MLTIFTTPKPFRSHINVIQTNAIKSWLALRPACEVILLGNDAGTAEFAAAQGVRHIPDVALNDYGTPLINSIFDIAQKTAGYPTMCYVNADILLLSDFLPAVRRVDMEKFLVVGQRWDFELNDLIDFSDAQWESRVKDRLAQSGTLHPSSGSDYFVFPRGLYSEIPAFALGRPGWDNWLIYWTRLHKIPVIDATRVITPIHQAHDYAHVPQGKAGTVEGPEAQQNVSLVGTREHVFTPKHANWVLTPRGVKRNFTPPSLYYRLLALPVLHPGLRFLGVPKRMAMAVLSGIRSLIGKNKK